MQYYLIDASHIANTSLLFDALCISLYQLYFFQAECQGLKIEGFQQDN